MLSKEELEALRNQPPNPGDQNIVGVMSEQFKAEVRENTERKIRLIEEAVKSGKISSSYANLLRLIDSASVDFGESNLIKVEAALSLSDELGKTSFGKGRVAYIGSGLDWQFPVSLGARKIEMVDFEFMGGEGVLRLFESVQRIDPEVSKDGEAINYKIDLGNGIEVVQLYPVGVDLAKYQPEMVLSGVLEFAGPTKTESVSIVKESVAAQLGLGSTIVNFDFVANSESPIDIPSLKMRSKDQFRLYELSDKEQFLDSLHSQVEDGVKRPRLSLLRKFLRSQDR